MTVRPAGWSARTTRASHAMFVMMNEARLGVGVQGLAQSEVAYQNAVDLRERAPAGPRDHRREIAGQAGRSDHRSSGCAAHADDNQGLQRSGARFRDLDRAARATSRIARRREGAGSGRRPHGPDDAGHQRRADRSGFANAVQAQQIFGGTATSPNMAWSSSCAMRASP